MTFEFQVFILFLSDEIARIFEYLSQISILSIELVETGYYYLSFVLPGDEEFLTSV